MHVLELGFIDAKKWLGDDVSIPMPASKPTTTPTTPPKNDTKTLPVVIDYLCNKRGLNRVMIEWCVSKGIIYSDHKANACFRYGTGVAMRGTGSIGFRANRGALTECFTLPARGNCEGVAILESAIDTLSYRQLHPTITACAIAGNGNGVLMRYALDLALRLEVPVFSAFDSDKGGNDGNDRLLKLNDGVNTIIPHRPAQPFKDWNECILRLSEEEKA
jgi:hypothetical protein